MIQHIHPFIILQFIRIKSQINQNTKTQGGPQFSLCCFVDEIAHHSSSEQCICAREWEKKSFMHCIRKGMWVTLNEPVLWQAFPSCIDHPSTQVSCIKKAGERTTSQVLYIANSD